MISSVRSVAPTSSFDIFRGGLACETTYDLCQRRVGVKFKHFNGNKTSLQHASSVKTENLTLLHGNKIQVVVENSEARFIFRAMPSVPRR